MNKSLSRLVFFALALVMGGHTYALTIPASEDTTGYADKLTLSAGAASALTADAIRVSYIYFDLADLPADSVIRWAKLRMYLPSVRSRGAGLGVHMVTSEWNEALASKQPAIGAETLGVIGPEKLGSRRFVTVDVTSTVQGWIKGTTANEGFAITPIIKAGTAVASVMLASKEGPMLGLPAELDLDFKPDFTQLPDSVQQYFIPSFVIQPAVLTSEGVITAEVTGVGPITYQWYKDGVPISGGTFSTFSLTGLTSGIYSLKVSNRFASVTSEGVTFDSSVFPIEFVSIPAGIYQRGNMAGDSDLKDAPVQTVNLSEYAIAVTDTTKAQWDTVRIWGTNNGYTDMAVGMGKAINHPVVGMDWLDAVKWANAASEREGLKPCYSVDGMVYRTDQIYVPIQNGYRNEKLHPVSCDWSADGYRLPTEAEWEVAARGGLVAKRFPSGDTISQSQANYYTANFAMSVQMSYDLSRSIYNYIGSFHAAYCAGDYPYTSPVGSFAANGYGLYDMAGNVQQWCWDWFGATSAGSDPRGPVIGDTHVVKGGGYGSSAEGCRVAARRGGNSGDTTGFRLVRKSRP